MFNAWLKSQFRSTGGEKGGEETKFSAVATLKHSPGVPRAWNSMYSRSELRATRVHWTYFLVKRLSISLLWSAIIRLRSSGFTIQDCRGSCRGLITDPLHRERWNPLSTSRRFITKPGGLLNPLHPPSSYFLIPPCSFIPLEQDSWIEKNRTSSSMKIFTWFYLNFKRIKVKKLIIMHIIHVCLYIVFIKL